MTTIGLVSAKHSPGVTTSALAIGSAIAEQTNALLVEMDPAGGDLAASCGLSVDRGLLSTLTTMRNAAGTGEIQSHLQRHANLDILVGPMSPTQMDNAIRSTGAAVLQTAQANFEVTLVDFGRVDFDSTSPTVSLLEMCDRIVIALRPTLGDVEHVRARLATVPSNVDAELLIVGSAPYTATEVIAAIGCPLFGQLPYNERDVELLNSKPDSKAARRTSLMRAARQIAVRILEVDHTPSHYRQEEAAAS